MVTNHIVRTFDSVSEVVSAARRGVTREMLKSPALDWNGNLTFDQACDLAVNGWSDMRPPIDEILTPVNARLSDILSERQERYLDITGAEVDMDRYLAGEMECMWEDIPQLVETRVFNVLCNNDASGVVSAETIARRGAAIAGIVEAFGIMGCEVNVWAEISSGGRQHRSNVHSVLVNVHRAGDFLDVNNIMFPIAHPSWLRRIMFAVFKGETPEVKEMFGFVDGYGSVHDVACAELVDASIIMSASKRSKADVDPVSWIVEQLQLQGVIPNGE